MKALHDDTPKSDVCETCSSSSYCSRLSLALKLLGDGLARSAPPAIALRYSMIRLKLAEGGWHFPHGTQNCRWHQSPDEIRQLTDELIQLAQLAREAAGPKSPISLDPPSLYQEETSHE